MSVELEIGRYSDNQELGGFKRTKFSSIDEAIANIEFMKLGFDHFKNGESLIVRLNHGSQPYLIDANSTVPIIELKRELESHYKSEKAELQYYGGANSLNSNFVFEKDENVKYAKTSTGEEMPFKLFSPDDSEVKDNMWNEENSTDFAFIERRFSESKVLEFSGAEKIENQNDVAWLFKALEDEAIEQAFLIYHFKDQSYFVQHISTGTFDQATVDNKVLIGNILQVEPESITLVHNHPSGNLKASRADFKCLENLVKALQYSDVKVNPGVIINLRSGNYLVFDEDYNSDVNRREKTNKDFKNITQYSFSKQVFVKDFQPIKISTDRDVAKYLSSQKFGVSDKTEMLVLNNQMYIVGKFIMPPQKQVEFIIDKVNRFGGTNCIIYGNNISHEEINFYNERLKYSRMSILDGILLKSENGQKIYKSFMAEDLLDKKKISEDINDNINEPSENLKNYQKSKKQENMENSFQITSYDKNQAFSNMKQFSSNSETVKTLSNLEFADKMNHSLIDLNTGEVKYINNPAELQLAISDFWAKELSSKTDLSEGLNWKQIDEKQSEHYRNYEAEFAKLDIDQKVKNTSYLTHDEINLIVPEERRGDDFHIKVSKVEAESLIGMNIYPEIMNKEYGDDDHWVGMTKEDFDEETNSFDNEYQTFEINAQPITKVELISLLSNINHIAEQIQDTYRLNNDINLTVERTAIQYAEHILNDGKISKLDEFKDYFEQLNPDRQEIFVNIMANHFQANSEKKIDSKMRLSEVIELAKSILTDNIQGTIKEFNIKYNAQQFVNLLLSSAGEYQNFEKYQVYNDELSKKNKEIFLAEVSDKIFDSSIQHKGDAWRASVEILNSNSSPIQKLEYETEIIGGKIKDIAAEAIRNPEYLKQFDINTQNAINQFIKSQNINNQKPQIMENKEDFDLVKHLKFQMKALGFGESEKLHQDLDKGIADGEQKFEVKTNSDRTQPGNAVDFTLNFSKSEKGGVFLNSYQAELNNEKGETHSQKFYVNKEDTFTAKEAVNLLEGRAVKIEFTNPKTDQKESAFVKLDFKEKNEYGNYNFQNFHQNYGVDTDQIVEKSELLFDKPEYKENTIKNLEKGNVVKVKFNLDDKVVEGNAVLNPQYKNLSLYDKEMNRLNTNKPLEGLDNDNKHQKGNVREQSMSRGH